MRTIKQLAGEVIDIQDACNMMGLTKGFARALDELADNLRQSGEYTGTDTINRHPITKLWASKLHDLARMGLSDTDQYGTAYEKCRELAGRLSLEECARRADAIYEEQSQAADAGAPFDVGEFSGSVSDELARRRVKELAEFNGHTYAAVQAELNRVYHEDCIDGMAADGPYGRIV
jgi:hypothetical protein